MQTCRFNPAIGHRYLRRLQGAADQFWVITAITKPHIGASGVLITFTEEITQRVIIQSLPQVANESMNGHLICHQAISDTAVLPPMALGDLIAKMSLGQLHRFKMRSSYVLSINRAGVGLSHKSQDFVDVINTHHQKRLVSWQARLASLSDGELIENIETTAPAATSVYRWCLLYRKSGDDMRVLAHEAFATRTRLSRKPQVIELLKPFLYSEMAAIGTTSIARLTDDFNQILKRADVLHHDQLIDELVHKTLVRTKQNQSAKKSKKSMKENKKRGVKNELNS